MTETSRILFSKQSLQQLSSESLKKMIFNKGTFSLSLWWEACLFLKIRCYVTNAPSWHYRQEDSCLKLAYTKPIMGNNKSGVSKSISPCSHFSSLPFQINIFVLPLSLLSLTFFIFFFRENTFSVLR